MKLELNEALRVISFPENLGRFQAIKANRKITKNLKVSQEYIRLSLGESPIPALKIFIEAVRKNMDKTSYEQPEGIVELREAISSFFEYHFGYKVHRDRIFIGPGSKELIFHLLLVTKMPMVIPTPAWIGYVNQVKILNSISKDERKYYKFPLRRENKYRIDPQELDDFFEEKKKFSPFFGKLDTQFILILTNPNNPSGVVYKEEELEKIVEVCRKHNTVILADEIYSLTTYDISQFTSLGKLYPEGTIVTGGASKYFSTPGFRFAYTMIPKLDKENGDLYHFLKNTLASIVTSTHTPTQFGAIEAYTPNKEVDEYLKISRAIHALMGKYLSRELGNLEGVTTTDPEGGFYFIANFNDLKADLKRHHINNTNDLSRDLGKVPYGISVVSGDNWWFDEEDYSIRIAFVDYPGEEVYEAYCKNPPQNRQEKDAFIVRYAPNIAKASKVFQKWIDAIRS